MGLANFVIKKFIKKRIPQIKRFNNYPHDVQHEQFRHLIRRAQDTEWGKKYEYSSITEIEQFKDRVPVSDYDDLKPLINRMINGEQNILWPSRINWFAQSSGTTSDKSKFLPISKEGLRKCHFQGSYDLIALYAHNNPATKLFDGKSLIMGGSHQVSKMNNNAYCGDVSAVMMQNMSYIASFFRTPDLSTSLMANWEEKIEKMAWETIEQNVTNIAGVPTWTLVLIKRLFEIKGKNNLLDIWPNLELYIHGGVNFKPYYEEFKKLIPSNDMCYLEAYNASEGFFSLQDQLFADEMLLMLDYGIFYEFCPLGELEKDQPKTYQLHEVETDVNYALIISTNCGLWRYKVGDTVKFTSLNPFRIQVSGRIKHFINAFGEEVMIHNTENAIAQACHETGATVKEYSVAPIYLSESSKGGHEWLIEFEEEPEELEQFRQILDRALQNSNSDYEAKRYKNLALQLPVIHPMPKGTFYNWLKSKGKLGGQHKVPRLANDRQYVEEIKSFAKMEMGASLQ